MADKSFRPTKQTKKPKKGVKKGKAPFMKFARTTSMGAY